MVRPEYPVPAARTPPVGRARIRYRPRSIEPAVSPHVWPGEQRGTRLPNGFRSEPRDQVPRNGEGLFVSEARSEYAEVTEMFRHLKALDKASPAFRRQREAIIERGLPIADHIAHRYSGRGEPFDDLVQAARIGLLNAVNRFDVDNGAEFLSFAVPTMMGEVRRHFRDYGWAIKVPRRVKELQPRLVRARAELSQQLGRAPNASEIADHLGIDREF